jgi:hypothetical protein
MSKQSELLDFALCQRLLDNTEFCGQGMLESIEALKGSTERAQILTLNHNASQLRPGPIYRVQIDSGVNQLSPAGGRQPFEKELCPFSKPHPKRGGNTSFPPRPLRLDSHWRIHRSPSLRSDAFLPIKSGCAGLYRVRIRALLSFFCALQSAVESQSS